MDVVTYELAVTDSRYDGGELISGIVPVIFPLSGLGISPCVQPPPKIPLYYKCEIIYTYSTSV